MDTSLWAGGPSCIRKDGSTSVAVIDRPPTFAGKSARRTSQCSGTSPSHSTPGGLEADVRVEATGDGAVDDGLLLLLQQLDQLLLGADVAPDPPVHVVEEADDGGLFGEGWEGNSADFNAACGSSFV